MSIITDIEKHGNIWIVIVNNNSPFIIRKSSRKGKKYDAYITTLKNGKLMPKYHLSFGDSKRGHYFDKLGKYENLNHLDKKRLKSFYQRFKNAHDVDTDSALFFSSRLLW